MPIRTEVPDITQGIRRSILLTIDLAVSIGLMKTVVGVGVKRGMGIPVAYT
jgi:hypothetical protein